MPTLTSGADRVRRGLGRLTVAAGLVAALAFAPAAEAETTLKIASAQQSAGVLPIIVATQRGLFTAEGLKIDIIDFSGGGNAVQALAGGSVDLCLCSADHAVRLASRGLGGAVLVALYDRNPYALLAKGGSPYTDMRSLKGQRIGITSAGSLTDNTVRYEIKKLGLDPDTDYQIISIGLAGPMRSALESGAIAAGMFTTPATQAVMARPGDFKIVEDFRKLNYASMEVVAVHSWLAAHDKTARDFAAAVVKAEHLIQTDPTVIEAAIKEMFPKLTPDVAKTVARDVVTDGVSPDGKVSKAGYDTMVTTLRLADPSVKAVPYKDVVLTQYLPSGS